MDLFGNSSQTTSDTAFDRNGRQVHVGSLVNYIGNLSVQYANESGAATGVIDRIDNGLITLRLIKDGKTYILKVTSRDISV